MLNKGIIMGRLTRDPELRYTQSNTPVSTFTVAVDRRFKTKEGYRETDFINCVAWRNNAEFVQKYFQKGRMISVVGSIQTRKYTDKEGNNRTATELVADEIAFCGDGNSARENAGAMESDAEHDTESGSFEDLEDDDELPF